MEIRPFDPDDDDDRAALWRLKSAFELEMPGDEDKRAAYEAKLTADYRDRYLAWVHRCLDDQPRSVVLAEADDDAVGYAFVLPERLAMVWDAAVLNEIYLAESHRGTGVGDALLEVVLDVARQQDLPLDRIVLDVDRENERARQFYERHGFEHWGEMVARDL